MQEANCSPRDNSSYIGDVVADGSNLGNVKDSMITGRDSDHSPDSPTASRTSSDSDEVIDHTAALLGFMEDSDEDDLREISGFSPAVSLDLELEPIGNEDDRNSTFEKIFSGDELDDDGTQQQVGGKLTYEKFTFSADEFQDNGSPVKQGRENHMHGKSQKSLPDDVSFFYFDSRLVAQAVEEYGQRKCTDIDNKRKQAALKAKALKDKASSAISHRARKAVAVPHAMWDKKVRKSHDEIGHADDVKEASKMALMKLRAKAALNEKAKKAKEKISLPKSIRDRKQKSCQEPKKDTCDVNFDKVYAKMCTGIKLPSMPTQPPIQDYMAKKSIAVIGDMHKLVKQPVSGSIPGIAACASNVSSNNSQIIDEAGFIISPTSSVDVISPNGSFDGIDTTSSAAVIMPYNIASPKSNRNELPPSGKNSGQVKLKKEYPNKTGMKLHKSKPRSHRRTTTASF